MKIFGVALAVILGLSACGGDGPSLLENNAKRTNNKDNNGENNGDNNTISKNNISRNNDVTNNLPNLTSNDPIVQFGYDFYLEVCKRIVTCRDSGGVVENAGASRIASTASCLETLIALDHPQRWKDSLDASRVTFTAGAKSACLSGIGSISCDFFVSTELNPQNVSNCEGVVSGVGIVGGDCSSSVDCSGSLYCGDCPGECKEFPGLECGTEICDNSKFCNFDTSTCETHHGKDESCTNFSECASGLSCIDGKCIERRIIKGGADCSSGKDVCALGYYCDSVCRSFKRLNESCAQNECESPLYCNAGKCEKAKSTGECTNGVECLSLNCIGGMCASPEDLCKLKEL